MRSHQPPVWSSFVIGAWLIPLPAEGRTTKSLQLLLQGKKGIGVEKINNGDPQPVAEFFYGGHGGAVVAAADNIVQGRLRYAADGCKVVHRDLILRA